MIRLLQLGRAVALTMSVVLLITSLPAGLAQAAMITTDQVIGVQDERGKVTAFLQRVDVRSEMVALGVDPAEAEARAVPAQRQEEEAPEFYAVRWPGEDGPPEYYRMTPEEAAEMARDVTGRTTEPTGTHDDAELNALAFQAQAVAESPTDREEKGTPL